MEDDPDFSASGLKHEGLDRGIGDPGDAGQCVLDGKHYPEGSIELVEGRSARCQQGQWVGIGDDPPFRPRRPGFLDDTQAPDEQAPK